MNEFLTQNWLVLNLLIPLLTALTILLKRDASFARKAFIFSSIISILLIFFMPKMGARYYFGGFEAPIGIEYQLDRLNFTIISYLNIILALFAMSLPWLKKSLEGNLQENKKHFLYSIILFAHLGFIGIASTGDIFNLYVFIEISSLSSYVLISMGSNRHSIVAAMDYLIIGTIAATFILVSIGMLYSISGTLNMEDMSEAIRDHMNSRIMIVSALMFVFGSLLKLAIFPLHAWIIKTYRHTSSAILTYMANISVVIGFYTIIRFIHSIMGVDIFDLIGMNIILQIVATIAMLAGAYLAYNAVIFRDIVLYSSIVQMGYILMMISATFDVDLIIQYILADGVMKFIFFVYIAQDEDGVRQVLPSYLTIFGILSNIGLPISVGFFNKVNLLTILLENMNYIGFVPVIIASVIGIDYNFRMINRIILDIDQSIKGMKYSYSLIMATILSLSLIFYGNI